MTIPEALIKLSNSKFRGRFKLNDKMKEAVERSGLAKIREFAELRVRENLAPASPKNDGRQTPMKGHAVFIAQHATATCCRTCLNRWWKVKTGVEMSPEQQVKAVNLIMAWIEDQLKKRQN